MKHVLADLKMYGRFAFGLRRYLRQKISPEEARAIVRKRLAERETNFLRLVERGIFGYRRSPYLPLLKLAGCEMCDIKRMVQTQGLEETLRELRRAGVYFTFEEFKGRTPVVRDGRTIPVEPRDFDNPYLSHYYRAESGGTTGAGTRVDIDLDHLAAGAIANILACEAQGVLDVPTAIWRPILPAGVGIGEILTTARHGNIPQKWFSPVTSRDLKRSHKYRLATHYFVVLGRMFGAPIPWPELVPLDQAVTIARWASETLKARGACFIRAPVSQALRICVAAREEGLDLTGATFMITGEPPTPAKVRQISRTGARYFPQYYFSELGRIGIACTRPVDTNDLHFVKDSAALIQHAVRVPGSVFSVPAFCFTSLLPTSPKLMLNVESDDYGVIEERTCGCPLEVCGFTEHLREVRSYRKLTGEGVTLVGSEMIHILEEVLPARFGGSPLDYQLLEEEDETGFTKLSLLVSPKVEIADEEEVIKAVLEALGQSSAAADMARSFWSQAQALRVKRMEPISTAGGKLMPLHLAQRGERSDNGASRATSTG